MSMSREQLQSKEQITPAQLITAMDNILFRFGQEEPNGTVSFSYILPGSEKVKIEDRPYGNLGRYEDDGGNLHYLTGYAIPHNGGSEKILTFGNDKVLMESQSWEQIGTDNQESRTKVGELSPEEIEGLYSEISDPNIAPRDRAIDAFYRRRHYSRSKIGRLIARVRDIDRPRYF
jgi:hypothetical protein